MQDRDEDSLGIVETNSSASTPSHRRRYNLCNQGMARMAQPALQAVTDDPRHHRRQALFITRPPPIFSSQRRKPALRARDVPRRTSKQEYRLLLDGPTTRYQPLYAACLAVLAETAVGVHERVEHRTAAAETWRGGLATKSRTTVS